MNHLDQIVHDWGWFNRLYTHLLIRSRGYHLVSMAEVLPEVHSIAELTKPKGGALLRLPPRKSLHDLPPPQVALGEHAEYVVDYYRREFPAREDHPFIAYFPRPVLYGRQFSIIDAQGQAFEECFTRDRRWREGVPKRNRRVVPRQVPGTYLLAGTEFHNHYAHLFCDVLPRLKLFEDAGLRNQFPYLLPPPSHAFAQDASQMLGLENAGALRWDDGCWQLDGLYFASSFKKFCSWTPESAAWIRQQFCPGIEQKPVGKKIFYISREGGPRSIRNEQQILAQLAPHDVTVVHADRLTLEQQINLFAEAGVIMGPHGAGIQNALWAPRGCRVLELVNPGYFSGIYWTLAESLEQPYGLVAGTYEADKHPLKDSYDCEPTLVRQALDQMITAT